MQLAKKGKLIASLDDWLAAAPPKGGLKQWCDGRSAKECARAWLAAGHPAVPSEIQTLFDSHPDTRGLVVEMAEPEVQIRFDGRRGESRNADVAFVGQIPTGPIVGTVEAKADEPFGALLPDTLADALERWRTSSRSGGLDRAKDLVRSLLPVAATGLPHLRAIRYQLLTAVAGTLACAAKHEATRAVLVVHEFQTQKTDDARLAANAEDLNGFLRRLTGGAITTLATNRMVGPLRVAGASIP